MELLLRPDLGRKPYRLKCRFIVGAHPSARTLEKAKYEAAGLFVRDMAKQGWQYMPQHSFRLRGPFPATETVMLPKRSEQERWHTPSQQMLQSGRFARAAIDGGYVRHVPLLGETDSWEFELAGVFIHETILTEVPDRHEERSA